MWSCKSIRSVNQVQITFMELLYHCWKKRQKFSSQHVTKHLQRGQRAPALLQGETKWLKRSGEHRHCEHWLTQNHKVPIGPKEMGLDFASKTELFCSRHLICDQFTWTIFCSSDSPFCSLVLLSWDSSHYFLMPPFQMPRQMGASLLNKWMSPATYLLKKLQTLCA